jgi:hypothetical protein
VGKLKKVGIGFGIVILSFFVLAAIGGSVPDTEIESTGIDNFKAKSYEEMNSSELSLIAVQYDYRDLMRNIDNYKGKIIFVDGTISNTQPNFDMITLYNEIGGSYQRMFIQTSGNYLVDDKISGYVKVHGLSETAPRTVLGTTMPSEFLPTAIDVRLTCSNC